MQFYTYLHCKPDGTPFYVGKGHNYNGHGRRSHDFNNGRNRHHKNTVAKYGKGNILVYIFPCESEEQAKSDEIQQIAQLRSEGYKLANITNGGESGNGAIPWNKGKMLSAEHKRKMAESRIGSKRTLETRAKMSASSKGKPKSDVARKNMSIASHMRWSNPDAKLEASIKSLGNKNCLGRKLSEETKRKIGNANRKQSC